jgi:6-phosphogluconolactonase
MQRTLIVGSYTEAGSVEPPVPAAANRPGMPSGVSVLELASDGTISGVLRSSTGVRNPSFVAARDSHVYAVQELDQGRVSILDAETLAVSSSASSGGAHPCHLVPVADTLLVANYSSGTVAVLPVRNGQVQDPVQVTGNPGSGPNPERQESSHAHQVLPTPAGTVLVSDLGADRVDEYGINDDGTLTHIDAAQLPQGAGPRHLALAGNGADLLVAGELDGQLHWFHQGGEGWSWQAVVPLSSPDWTPAAPGEHVVQPSHVELSADGTLLYAAVRGRNSLLVFDVAGLADGVAPRLLSESDCGGNWPRHFAVAGNGKAGDGHGLLYVANERSHHLSVFALDAAGLPEAVPVQQFPLQAPTCVVLR